MQGERQSRSPEPAEGPGAGVQLACLAADGRVGKSCAVKSGRDIRPGDGQGAVPERNA